jgi:FkbM family methyltransferase
MTEFDELEEAFASLRSEGVDLQDVDRVLAKIKSTYIKKLPEYFQRIGYLRYLASEPKTIIDVGVSHGTKNLYDAFPDLPFILIDPQKGGENLLTQKPKEYTFIQKGLGAEPGVMTLNESASQSSFVERDGVFDGDYPTVDTYDVEITTLANIVEELNPEPPFGIKIDTEGFELEVLKGMNGIFDKVDFLICETSIRRVYKDSYQFSELVAFLAEHGLLFYNILNDVAPWPRYYDTVFLQKDNPKFISVR